MSPACSVFDRWARRAALFAVVSVAATLLWLGLTLFKPTSAAAAGQAQISNEVADSSARSTR